MPKILCPCKCGKWFKPSTHGGDPQLYATKACGNRVRARRLLAKRKQEKLLLMRAKQPSLQFKPKQRLSERRGKTRVPSPAKEEPRLFA
jgi:hypothetical protein